MTEPSFLLDANICIYLLEGKSRAAERRVEQHKPGALVTSAIAYAEVMLGAVRSDGIAQALAFFKLVPVLPFDARAADAYSNLPFKRGSYDRLIAAQALSLGITIVTSNEVDFADIPDLRVENWTR